MLSKNTIAAGFAAIFALGTVACAADNSDRQVIYTGGHDAARLVQSQPKEAAAPYALTGEQATKPAQRAEPIWIGSRFAGVRVIGE